VSIHHADAREKRWPKGRRFDVVWHDIWPTLSPANLDGMSALVRRYASRPDWQACWGQKQCRWMRDVEREMLGITPPRRKVRARR
jgi:hypothetical protein